MLNSVSIENFKCYFKEDFELRNLPLLAGVNGVGKSTFIQALLLLQQTASEGCLDKFFVTNGHLTNLGSADDVLNEYAEDSSVSIIMTCCEASREYAFFKQDDKLLPHKHSSSTLPFESLLYLCAERHGPSVHFSSPSSEQSKYNRIGNNGEYAAYILSTNAANLVGHPDILIADFPNTVLGQTEAWLSRFGRSLRIHIDNQPHMDCVNLQYSYLQGKMFSRPYRATNIGFGITYALPIIVAVLSALPGELIILENPEAHLHPKGQAIMGEFLALAAQAGIQIIVETHSDHILNSIRVAVKQKKIAAKNLIVHFFSCSNDDKTCIIRPQIDDYGRFDCWPDDFFDEWDKQLAALIGD